MIGQSDAAVPVIGGRFQPLCAAYRCRSAGAIARGLAAGERRLTVLVESLKIRRVDEAQLRGLDPELTSFTNINTPEDYQRALRMATCGR
jgi:molybdopterin-guanine dinucleotide biosynthesis protein A